MFPEVEDLSSVGWLEEVGLADVSLDLEPPLWYMINQSMN